MNASTLKEFEKEIHDLYADGKIRGVIHLSGGNEGEILKVFEKVSKDDWVFSNHRSHYHALLKSKNPEWVKQQILDKKSMHINSKEYKIFTSSIVGGHVSIALGVALALRLKHSRSKVWCFYGDMASHMGIVREANEYAMGHNLPIKFVVEDNRRAVYTPTRLVWGKQQVKKEQKMSYTRVYPHHGIGKFINF